MFELQKAVDQIMDISRDNLDKAILRGDKIEVLMEKTKTMSALSMDLRDSSKVRNVCLDSQDPDDVEELEVENHHRISDCVGDLFHPGAGLRGIHYVQMFLICIRVNVSSLPSPLLCQAWLSLNLI